MTTSSSQTVNPNATLSDSTFLQLMITQMQYQDPLSSSSGSSGGSDFLTELAQFATMEQLTNLATEEQTIQSQTGVALGAQLLGRTVTLEDSSGAQSSGTVTSVALSSGSPNVVVNGQSYPISDIVDISS